MVPSGSCKRAWLVGACALTWIAAGPAAAVEITAIETIALRFETAPGAGATYQLFNSAVLNDAGEVLFWADDSNGARGLWRWTGSGEESLVAVTGAPAPGFATVPLDTISGNFWLTADGPVFFGLLDRVEGVTALTDDLLYGSNASGMPVLIARSGNLAPGLGGATFGSPLGGQVSSDFGTLFHNRSEPAGGGFGDNCLWRYDGSVTTLLAIEDGFAPGAPGFQFSGFFGNVMNDLGVTLTHVRLAPFKRSLYSFGDGAPQLIALEGAPAPGTGANFLIPTENADELGINNAGEIAFLAYLDDSTSAVFAPDGAGGQRVLARSDDPAPGTAGAVFASPDDLALGGDGSMVIDADLEVGIGGTTTATDSGLWGTAGDGPLQLIAREGGQPAGLPAGSTFGPNPRFALNGSGEVILVGTYTAPGLGTGDGLWHHDLYTSETSLLLRKGDVVEVAPGDFRTITFLSALGRAAGGQDGRSTASNDAGQIAATMTFSDNSRGVFRITVPEPASSAALTALGALVALARRRAPA
jgi:hypothetical protein